MPQHNSSIGVSEIPVPQTTEGGNLRSTAPSREGGDLGNLISAAPSREGGDHSRERGDLPHDSTRTRAEINRDNATKSSGPRTEEGKNKSKFNARRHNLSGQTIIGTKDEMAAYFHSSVALKSDFAPVGEFETRLVQSLADAQWQLDRARAIETNILFGAASRHVSDDTDSTGAFDGEWATGLSKAFLEHAKELDLISRYATRYHRQVLQIHDRLWRIQKERKKQEQDRNLERKRRHNDDFAKHQQAAQNQSDTNTPGFVSQPGSTGLQACELPARKPEDVQAETAQTTPQQGEKTAA